MFHFQVSSQNDDILTHGQVYDLSQTRYSIGVTREATLDWNGHKKFWLKNKMEVEHTQQVDDQNSSTHLWAQRKHPLDCPPKPVQSVKVVKTWNGCQTFLSRFWDMIRHYSRTWSAQFSGGVNDLGKVVDDGKATATTYHDHHCHQPELKYKLNRFSTNWQVVASWHSWWSVT